MRDDKSDRMAETRWRMPVAAEDVPEDGQTFVLEADADARAAIAKVAGLRDLPQLAATFDVRPQGSGGLRVVGRVSATVGQTCVVTLEALLNPIEEDVDVLFMPQVARPAELAEKVRAPTAADRKWNDPEPLVDGIVDLAALATEFLILGLDPYPRKPGAVFEAPRQQAADAGPFAALAGWAKDRHGR